MATTERHRHPKFFEVWLCKRPRSRFWYVEHSHKGTKHRTSLKTTNRTEAEDTAEEWFLDLLVAIRGGTVRSKATGLPTIRDAAEAAMRTFKQAQRNGAIEIVEKEADRRIREMYEDFLSSDWFIEHVGANHEKHAEIMRSSKRPANMMSFGEFKLSRLNRQGEQAWPQLRSNTSMTMETKPFTRVSRLLPKPWVSQTAISAIGLPTPRIPASNGCHPNHGSRSR